MRLNIFCDMKNYFWYKEKLLGEKNKQKIN